LNELPGSANKRSWLLSLVDCYFPVLLQFLNPYCFNIVDILVVLYAEVLQIPLW